MSCKVLILVMLIPNGEWRFSDVLKMQKISRECEKHNNCLKKVEKTDDGLNYKCIAKEEDNEKV